MSKILNLEDARKLISKNPFCMLLQMEVTEVSEGHVAGKLPFSDKYTNMYHDFHGGVLAAAADTFCGLAAMTYGNYVYTIDANVQYLKAGRNTAYLLYDAQVIKTGKNIIVVQFRCNDERGLLIDTGTLTFIVSAPFDRNALE